MLAWKQIAAGRPWGRVSRLVAVALVLTIVASGCASRSAGQRISIPAEVVEWEEKTTYGVDRVFMVKIAYRDLRGALCMTTVELDQSTWTRVRRDGPCLVPYRRGYTVA